MSISGIENSASSMSMNITGIENAKAYQTARFLFIWVYILPVFSSEYYGDAVATDLKNVTGSEYIFGMVAHAAVYQSAVA